MSAVLDLHAKAKQQSDGCGSKKWMFAVIAATLILTFIGILVMLG